MMLKKVSYTIAKSADIPALSTLINSAYRGEISKLGWTHEAALLEGPRLNAETLAAEVIQPGSVRLWFTSERICADAYYSGDMKIGPILDF